ncbi:MAG TPA: mercuric reductase [Gemmatimonadaceae bacterium]|nr:mercuric reductase [Gemmatimonadaceae bacterium]
MEEFDLIVIGSGQGGGPLASAFANGGHRVALVERKHVGGTCVNEGCTPTKTMVASARAAWMAGRASEYGVLGGRPRVEMRRVRERKRAIVDQFREGGERRLRRAGVMIVEGEGRFTGSRTVRVTSASRARTLRAPLVVINAGLRPRVPALSGLESIAWLDSTSIMELDVVPRHLLVLGGGYVGVEFAQMFRRFGSHVTMVQRGEQLLPREDRDIADAVAEILLEDGLDIRVGAELEAVERSARRGGGIRAMLRSGDDTETIEASHLLIATGRVPNTEGLGLAEAGVEMDADGFIRVDDRLATTAEGTYAMGDIKGAPAFTHISYDDFRILRANLLENDSGVSRSSADRIVPYTMFMDPQLGRVGITEEEARAAGTAVRVARMPMSHVARALEVDEPRGVMKVVVDAGSDRMLGAAILGIEGGELASMIQVAMLGDLPYTALRDGIFAHPLLAESFNNLFTALDRDSPRERG